MGRFISVLIAGVLLLAPGAAGQARAGEYPDIDYDPARYGPELPLEQIALKAGVVLDSLLHVPAARIEVDKGRRSLRLFAGDLLLKTYRIQLGGRHPSGPKRRRGDGRTPEGTYRICRHNGASRYYRALWLDYPSTADIDAAVALGRVSEAQVAGLRAALAAGDCPPSNTPLGGDILIHGQHPKVTAQIRRDGKGRRRKGLEPGDIDPAREKRFYDWTLGCIGMANPDIRELFRCVPNGTVVQIIP